MSVQIFLMKKISCKLSMAALFVNTDWMAALLIHSPLIHIPGFRYLLCVSTDVTIGLRESDVVISESGRTVSLCVSISKRVARALAFRLTTRNGTAKSEFWLTIP